MSVYYSDDVLTLHHGDAREVLATMVPASVDSICTDAPYELGFMGKTWDSSGIAYSVEMWAEALRVLKPGGHLLAFGGTRTYHRMVCAIEDAGFEIRDSIHWIYGSGFPKSLDVSKAIDKAAGATREITGRYESPERTTGHASKDDEFGFGLGDMAKRLITAPATPAAAAWSGWGTALKPAHEPIVVARKPLAGTVAANVLAHGTGALNIDGCRVATSPADARAMERANTPGSGRFKAGRTEPGAMGRSKPGEPMDTTAGRWPANVILDETAAAELDAQSGMKSTGSGQVKVSTGRKSGEGTWTGTGMQQPGRENTGVRDFGDTGGASRFFPVFRYEAKAPTAERPRVNGAAHATVKPLDLMRWLIRLVTPPGGIVLDPFAGSGTTGEAAVIEGFHSVLVELDPAHLALIVARVTKPIQPVLFGGEVA